jgi:RNA polymerase sigma factor (sigma-70 family)
MAAALPNFKELLDRINQGDERAADELYQHYNSTLTHIVRLRLTRYHLMLPVCDDEDVTQDAWMSIFRLIREGRPFETKEEVVALFKQVALRKSAKVIRRFLFTATRDLRRRESPEASVVAQASVADPAPDPQQTAENNELLERALESLSPGDRLLLHMRMQGHSLREIAAEIGCDERTVPRPLMSILSDLEQSLGTVR